MLNYITADWVYPVSAAPIKNGVLALDAEGRIAAIIRPEEAGQILSGITRYTGVLVPGFVNTHCHLELSHLEGKIAEGTGLTHFIRGVVALRQEDPAAIERAMFAADRAMYQNGIVAVGDISNALDSRPVKIQSKLYYHTFVEVFGFNRPSAPIIQNALHIKQGFEPLKASIVPHAPYSVSEELFNEIRAITTKSDILSIHNQETDAENELFEKGTGKFADFFDAQQIAKSAAHGSGLRAIHYHLPQLSNDTSLLLVHNTFSEAADVRFAESIHKPLFWCLCPHANYYIERTLPDTAMLQREGVKITLGTDSLASNHQLSILAEMQLLQKEKELPFTTLLEWATLNGAQSLGVANYLGSFEPGKQPGIVLLENFENEQITENTRVKRLI